MPSIKVRTTPIEPAIIRQVDLRAYLQLGRGALKTLVDSPEHGFPSPIKLGPRCIGWEKAAVDAWIKKQAETAENGASK